MPVSRFFDRLWGSAAPSAQEVVGRAGAPAPKANHITMFKVSEVQYGSGRLTTIVLNGIGITWGGDSEAEGRHFEGLAGAGASLQKQGQDLLGFMTHSL